MTKKSMDQLLRHVQDCNQFSVDTESEKSNNKIALVQVHTLPSQLPSYVILFELSQFPDGDSRMYELIKSLFALIFRHGNEIYSWDNMQKELDPIKELIPWPIAAKLIDLQRYFSGWYEWARTQCSVRSLANYDVANGISEPTSANQATSSSSVCSCHKPSPYKAGERWSLQSAMDYGYQLFLDKSNTRNHWATSLTSNKSTLSYSRRQQMIQYACDDVLAVTHLIRPVTERWTFQKTKTMMINELFIQFQSKNLPPIPTSSPRRKIKSLNVQKLAQILGCSDSDIESISDDGEIYLNQLNDPVEINLKSKSIEVIQLDPEPVENELEQQQHITSTSDDEPVHGEEESLRPSNRSKNQRRSARARKIKNKKHNTDRRKHRYRCSITRRLYYRFSLRLVRRVLRLYNIKFIHIKRIENGQILIGLKNNEDQHDAEQNLSMDIFDRRGYFHYQKKFRC